MSVKIATCLFEITSKCNLNCIHCYRRHDQNNLSFQDIKKIIDRIVPAGITNLILTGGEPFLRADLFKIIDYSADRGITDIAINTNGTLFDNPQIISEIQKRLDIITSIPVSFDGATSQTHDYIRGRGKFTELMTILKGKSLSDFPVSVNVTIGKWNFNDFDEFFTLYEKYA